MSGASTSADRVTMNLDLLDVHLLRLSVRRQRRVTQKSLQRSVERGVQHQVRRNARELERLERLEERLEHMSRWPGWR